MEIEGKLKAMGIMLPELGKWDSNLGTAQKYYGQQYGKMKPFHRTGNLLFLSGHVPDLPDGTAMHPGRVGAEVTVEQAYKAARQTGINCLAGTGLRWKTRVFVPAFGVPEDPATGSAAGPLALHLARHGRIAWGDEIEITQGVEIKRPSKLYARAEGADGAVERVEVGGSAVVVARGEFKL